MDKEIAKVWDKILNIRSGKRFSSIDIMKRVCNSFWELHGDRFFGDDAAIVGGLACLENIPVTVIAQYRGNSPEERIRRNYGMPMPEGYRKAMRLMKQAEKFGRAVICFIDTPGAFPGIEAEERGQAEAIARNLSEMSLLKVPIISLIVGEGGSGGALALAVSNKLFMMENAVFSVVSPEGCASILWKDSKLAPKAAENLKITATDLAQLGIIDGIFNECNNFEETCKEIRKVLFNSIKEYKNVSGEDLAEMRTQISRKIGVFLQ